MNTKKIKKCDYLTFLCRNNIVPETVEIYPCADGEHFVVKQGKNKIVLELEDYTQFLAEVNRVVYKFLDKEYND